MYPVLDQPPALQVRLIYAGDPTTTEGRKELARRLRTIATTLARPAIGGMVFTKGTPSACGEWKLAAKSWRALEEREDEATQ